MERDGLHNRTWLHRANIMDVVPQIPSWFGARASRQSRASWQRLRTYNYPRNSLVALDSPQERWLVRSWYRPVRQIRGVICLSTFKNHEIQCSTWPPVSTRRHWQKGNLSMSEHNESPRKIIGFSMNPELAIEVKAEAAQRGISLRKLFEEMWALYQNEKNK